MPARRFRDAITNVNPIRARANPIKLAASASMPVKERDAVAATGLPVGAGGEVTVDPGNVVVVSATVVVVVPGVVSGVVWATVGAT